MSAFQTNAFQTNAFQTSGAPPPAPEIAVAGNSVNIVDGDATPSSLDHTDFGDITQGGATVSRTFTVNNLGTATLNISGATVPTGFTITKALASTILASNSDTLIVRLDNAIVGTKSGDIVISSDDLDEATFNFAITGVVNSPPPPPPPPPPPSGTVRTSRTDAIRGTVFGLVVS